MDTFNIYQQGDRELMYWAKLVKIVALSKISPFKITLFNDADNLPCYADFGSKIITQYNLNPEKDGSYFDIAVMPQGGHKNKERWFDDENWQASKSQSFSFDADSLFNMYNT